MGLTKQIQEMYARFLGGYAPTRAASSTGDVSQMVKFLVNSLSAPPFLTQQFLRNLPFYMGGSDALSDWTLESSVDITSLAPTFAVLLRRDININAGVTLKSRSGLILVCRDLNLLGPGNSHISADGVHGNDGGDATAVANGVGGVATMNYGNGGDGGAGTDGARGAAPGGHAANAVTPSTLLGYSPHVPNLTAGLTTAYEQQAITESYGAAFPTKVVWGTGGRGGGGGGGGTTGYADGGMGGNGADGQPATGYAVVDGGAGGDAVIDSQGGDGVTGDSGGVFWGMQNDFLKLFGSLLGLYYFGSGSGGGGGGGGGGGTTSDGRSGGGGGGGSGAGSILIICDRIYSGHVNNSITAMGGDGGDGGDGYTATTASSGGGGGGGGGGGFIGVLARGYKSGSQIPNITNGGGWYGANGIGSGLYRRDGGHGGSGGGGTSVVLIGSASV